MVAAGQQQKSIVTEAQVSLALDAVIDPHMKVGMNDMGMITNIDIDDQANVAISMVFPCLGCPAWTLIQDNIKSEVGASLATHRHSTSRERAVSHCACAFRLLRTAMG